MRRVKIGGAATGREVRLVMRPHCVLDAGVGIVNVSHGNVAVAVAWLDRHHGRGTSTWRRVICVMHDGRSRAYSSGGGSSIGMILIVAVGGSSSRLRVRSLLGLLRLLLKLRLWLLLLLRCGDGWRLASVVSRHLRVASVVIVTAHGTGRRVLVLLPVGIHCSEAAKGADETANLDRRRAKGKGDGGLLRCWSSKAFRGRMVKAAAVAVATAAGATTLGPLRVGRWRNHLPTT